MEAGGMMDWLKGKEHNTIFFRSKATQRKKRKSEQPADAFLVGWREGKS